uniref:Epithelial chloride channel protein-like n=1 Tax=Saccoglossus kowalevskii TaxID=10224 RepID=A0ABM0GKI7_SACKO|nr:PREDICTED: epithelial chloride channel protein-like [Saccoglossus kowalevskii]
MISFLFCCLALATISCIVPSTHASWRRGHVKLEENGYTGIVIAIHSSIPENVQIIEQLQVAFTDASDFLFTATKRRAYFKDISILIPTTWSHKSEYSNATKESYEKANIIVDTANAVHGHTPYVKRIGGCGKKGEYLHLTPTYLLDRQQSQQNWGPVGRLLVHEWAHLHWGVFDEYPTHDDDYFYVSANGKIEATRCSLQIKGSYKQRGSVKDCDFRNITKLQKADCHFIPTLSNASDSASLMYMQFLPTITGFCHNNISDLAGYHNREAPNKQNKQCMGKSVWEIILNSEDFEYGTNLPVDPTVTIDTTPRFRIVQSRERRLVLVLDRSGSMEGVRLTKLRQAASAFIRNTICEGSYLGIVEFSEFAQELAPLTLVNGSDSREGLIRRLPHSVGGWTSIGAGIMKGIEVLSTNGQNPEGGLIMAISDGGENRAPTLSEALQAVDESGVTIDTIAYSEQADENLASLAARTGGMSFFYSGDDDSTVLEDAFATSITSRAADFTSDDTYIKLWSEVVHVSARGENYGHLYIDSTVGMETEFSFTYTESRVTVVIKRPDSSIIDATYDGYKVDDEFHRVVVTLREHSRVPSKKRNIPQIQLRERHLFPPDDEPHPSTQQRTKPHEPDNRKQVTIYAEVSKGYQPILDSDVTALIDRPPATTNEQGSTIAISLLDNGSGSDIEKGDGIYSVYFLDFTSNGYYGVRVVVTNDHGNARLKLPTASGHRAIHVDDDSTAPTSNTNTSSDQLESFNRVVSGGAFKLNNYDQSTSDENLEDIYPPSRITELTIVEVSSETRHVTLSWTAPGDDLDRGTAAAYELRVGESYSELYDDFQSATPLNNSYVIEGNFSTPKLSGLTELFVVRIPEYISTLRISLSVRAVDDAGLFAEPSNIVSTSFESWEPDRGSMPTTTIDTTITTNDKFTVDPTPTTVTNQGSSNFSSSPDTIPFSPATSNLQTTHSHVRTATSTGAMTTTTYSREGSRNRCNTRFNNFRRS